MFLDFSEAFDKVYNRTHGCTQRISSLSIYSFKLDIFHRKITINLISSRRHVLIVQASRRRAAGSRFAWRLDPAYSSFILYKSRTYYVSSAERLMKY